MEFTIGFNAGGWINQKIEITDEDYKNYSKEHIINMFNRGEILTTVQENGVLFGIIDNQFKRIGTVKLSDNNMEYTDFEEIK